MVRAILTELERQKGSHSDKIIRRIELYIFPWIGRRSMAKVSAMDVLTCLRRIEAGDKLETAKRALQNCRRIFRYAVATGRREDNPAEHLRGAIPPARERHLAAITTPRELAPSYGPSMRIPERL